jgi:ATP phosphoribosyltransferase regulatory subunit
MALQPAAGVRDLNPVEVERNRSLCRRLASVYSLWGYRQVAPPTVERADTLEAGGAIDEREVVRLVSGEALGLRPELTAPIARAASTRLATLPRPLRLWSEGPIFRSVQADGALRILEQLQSGVELLGEPSAAADVELLRLLLAAAGSLGLEPGHRPRLLLGHHGLLSLLLERIAEPWRPAARLALTSLNALALAELPLAPGEGRWLRELSRLRGKPGPVLEVLRGWLQHHPLLNQLQATLELVAPAAERQGVKLLLDPCFQPHFALYDGLVLQLVCEGRQAPVAIASGGRYDGLVGRFQAAARQSDGAPAAWASGVGFGFDIEAVRELPGLAARDGQGEARVLVAFAQASGLAAALNALEDLHTSGRVAELHGLPVADREAAQILAARRGCTGLTYLA